MRTSLTLIIIDYTYFQIISWYILMLKQVMIMLILAIFLQGILVSFIYFLFLLVYTLLILLLGIQNCDNRSSRKGEMLPEPGCSFVMDDLAIKGLSIHFWYYRDDSNVMYSIYFHGNSDRCRGTISHYIEKTRFFHIVPTIGEISQWCFSFRGSSTN